MTTDMMKIYSPDSSSYSLQASFADSSYLSRPPEPVAEDGYRTTNTGKQTGYNSSQGSNKAALRVTRCLRSDGRPGIAGSFGQGGNLYLSWTKEADQIMILKLQCYSCEYDLVQDTKRDPKGAMLDICREIHERTYPSHKMEILQLTRDELEMMLASKHPGLRLHYRYPRKEHMAPIFQIMSDLAKMEHEELEDLWSDYGARDR